MDYMFLYQNVWYSQSRYRYLSEHSPLRCPFPTLPGAMVYTLSRRSTKKSVRLRATRQLPLFTIHIKNPLT